VLTGDLTREPPCGEIEELEISGAEVLSRAPPGGSTPLPDYRAELATRMPGLGDDPAFAVRHPTLTLPVPSRR